jgi:cation diffusion facilitator family transporter
LTPEKLGQRMAMFSMVVSAMLATAKIVVGLHANSTAVVSDGLESTGDVLASGLVLLGLVLAAKPADDAHPYGHGRMETLSALAVGILLIASGTLISFRSLQRIWEVQDAPAFYAIWPLIVSIAVKVGMGFTKWRMGRKIRSSAMRADAMNDMLDVLSGSTALLGLGLTLFDPKKFVAADHFGGAAVGVIVIFAGIRVVRETALQLIDTMPDEASMERIREVGLSVPGAKGIEKCFARKTGLQWHVDLHLEVDPSLSVYESHEIATEVRIKIKETLKWVADVLVHVEPYLPQEVPSGLLHGKS